MKKRLGFGYDRHGFEGCLGNVGQNSLRPRWPDGYVGIVRMGGALRFLIFVLIVLFSGLANSPVLAQSGKLVHVVRFSDYKQGSIHVWLQGKGFKFEQDARRRNLIDLDIGRTGLVLQAKQRAFGILPNESVNVPVFTRIEIDWGVNTFPKGSSYEQGVRNEALMVIVFMGNERHPSGSLFIPNSPYFVGLFLCNGTDRLNHPYVGAYFKKSGRYVCTGKPKRGQMVTSRFNLLKAYRTYFDKKKAHDPAVSGIALALDTKKASGGGRTSAFVREIRFYR